MKSGRESNTFFLYIINPDGLANSLINPSFEIMHDYER